MTEEQKQYIEQNIELIDNKEWEKFFSQLPDGVGVRLYEAGINFLEDVSEIFVRMFDFSDLTELVIPNNITSIGSDAFYRCKSLSRIDIPDSVTSIGDWAFYRCDSLTSIDIPASVTRIGKNAFFGCTKLTKAVVNNPNVTFGKGVFAHVSPSFELYGYTGSTAEDYANKNKLTFVAID